MHFYDFHPTLADLRREVIQGLTRQPRAIAPKFFYDAQGSRLFDAITELPEYYLTRTEIGILQTHGKEMAERIGGDCLLLELGSGSSRKIRVLLDALSPAAYLPIDISKQHLLESARALTSEYPALEIHAVCADYSDGFDLPYGPEHMPRTAFFPGSSIGNFEQDDAEALLRRVAKLVRPGGALLIGVDLQKDPARLNAAYNDAQGITAAFNSNLLERINRELGADFRVDRFRHHAFYDEVLGRVEMHLVSRVPQEVRIGEQTFSFAEGESIHTENSYKYTIGQFHELAASAGFQPRQVWTDAEQLFSVHYLRLAS